MATEGSRDGISHERQAGIAFWSGRRWAYHLSVHPEDRDECDWARLTGWDWAKLLSAQPQLADKCDWAKLNNRNWARLLAAQPQFAEKCHFSKFDCEDWSELLSVQPQFADRCDWDLLLGLQANILAVQPHLADRCDWSKLKGANWSRLLSAQPQFAEKCKWRKLDGADWIELLNRRPAFAERCDWSRLTSLDWEMLLSCRPEFADRCDLRGLPSGSLLFILARHPHLKSQCNMDVFSKEEQEYMRGLASAEEGFPDLISLQNRTQDDCGSLMIPLMEWVKRHDIVRRTFIAFSCCMRGYKKEEPEEYEEARGWDFHPQMHSINLRMEVLRGRYVSCVLDVARINHEEGEVEEGFATYEADYRLDGKDFDDWFWHNH